MEEGADAAWVFVPSNNSWSQMPFVCNGGGIEAFSLFIGDIVDNSSFPFPGWGGGR